MTKRKAKLAAQVAAVILICALVGWDLLMTWAEHPAEQPVSGTQYMEEISR